jgi:hypothetical protein
VSVACDSCGRTAEGVTPPITWSLSIERGRAVRLCEECTRTNLRAMEGKLDSQFW